MTQPEVIEILKQYKKENSKKYGITNLGIFGSYSKGVATDDSDIDIIRNREKMNTYLKKRIEKDAQYV